MRFARSIPLACAALLAAAPVAHAAEVVRSPRSGATVTGNTARIVVRAGTERSDLDAKLNGVEIGRHFARRGKGLRVLRASVSHGLKLGTNVLRVEARLGRNIRTATVRFKVCVRDLVGAGRDRRSPAGVVARLKGKVVTSAARRKATRARWRLVSAPAASRFVRKTKKAGSAGAPEDPPVESLSVPLTRVGSPTAPRASFRPDVPGTYKLNLTATTGAKTITHQVTLDALPRDPVLTVDTMTTGGWPNTAEIAPAIKLGGTTYTAPPMSGGNTDPQWAGNGYYSLWQVIAVDRTTLAPLWNRNYGRCGSDFCRIDDGGQPVTVDPAQELASLGEGYMVIAVSQPPSNGQSQHWGDPNEGNFATGVLSEIGFPNDPTLLEGAHAGSVSVIGVPGMENPNARFNVTPGGKGEMVGYLGADANDHYSFMPAQRIAFDTRSNSGCSASQCAITQTVGTTNASDVVPNGQGGFLVSIYDGHSLQLEGKQSFVTTNDPSSLQASGMADVLETANAAGSLVVVTSMRSPGLGSKPLVDPSASVSAWRRLANAVAAVGGNRHWFNTTVAGKDIAYSLVGWGGAGENNGTEITNTADGRIRGALAPNERSLFRPVNPSAVGEPADDLAQLVLRKPVTQWPLDNNKGAHAALKWIGSQINMLGDSPRQAYWYQTITQADANAIRSTINGFSYDDSPKSYRGVPFSASQFEAAQKQLRTEIKQVGKVRDYLSEVSAPQTLAGGLAWEGARNLHDKLEAELSDLQAQAAVQFDFLAIAESLLDFIGGFAGDPEAGEQFGAVVQAFAAATEFSDALFNGLWDGSPGSATDRTVAADDLGVAIQQQAKNAASSYTRMGDMIVADPTKLQELGTYGGCDPNGGCGPNGRYDDYAFPKTQPTANGAVATLAINRILYSRLVPLAFPVYKTGKTTVAPDPGSGDVPNYLYSCFANVDNPFEGNGAPPGGRVAFLESIDPASPGVNRDGSQNVWAVDVLVARSGATWGFPGSTILNTMFTPLPPSGPADQGPLGLQQADMIPFAQPVFQPSAADRRCGWAIPPA